MGSYYQHPYLWEWGTERSNKLLKIIQQLAGNSGKRTVISWPTIQADLDGEKKKHSWSMYEKGLFLEVLKISFSKGSSDSKYLKFDKILKEIKWCY